MTKSQIRLLIVDDHTIVRVGLKTALKSQSDFVVVGEAADGSTALQVAAECKPDVVLMDIHMPVMNGFEATNQFKASANGPKVLIFTSNDNTDEMFAALAAGADGYCLKDTSADKLGLAIRTVNAGVLWLDPEIAKVVLKISTTGSTPDAPSNLNQATEKPASTFNLSERELQVLELVVEGMSNQEIGKKLFLSSDTVKTHMTHIISKLAVSDRTQAAVKALREGLIA